MGTMLAVPTGPAPPAVPAILAVPFFPVALRPWVLAVSVAVRVPGIAAPPALAVTAPAWPCPRIPAVSACAAAPASAAAPACAEAPACAVAPAAWPPLAALTALSNSPLLTNPVTPWAPSEPVKVCALTERLGIESPPTV